MTINLIIEPWHWVVMSFIILGIESLGFGGFLLGAATASAVNGFILWWFADYNQSLQLVVFGLNSILLTFIYWKFWFKKRKKNNIHLHNRAAQLVGTIITAPDDIPLGISRLQIGDTMWRVSSEQAISKQQSIKIYACDGMTLLIQPSDVEIITKC